VQPANTALNAICPYFTMFPLEFPLRILRSRARPGDAVLDPFAGRGTTNYAARLLGLHSVGIDSSPVAIALTEAKLANATAEQITECAEEILGGGAPQCDIPHGEFWQLAFHPDVLIAICTLRETLLIDCRTDSRKALRGLLLGALHGPLTKQAPSYLSNQCTRTYAPKPGYAVRFWKARTLSPPYVDVRSLIETRANRYYNNQEMASGTVIDGDSRQPSTFSRVTSKVRWTITSPPYYGMRTYIPDQWLRNWFVGGPPHVDYSNIHQLEHSSPLAFADQLRSVWENISDVATEDAHLVVRFGGISDRNAHPLEILKASFQHSSWRLKTVVRAGSADHGKRQATQFASTRHGAREEHDAWLCRR
jgi:hypothetical protein